MIYCFKGCCGGCKACGKACDELGKCCSEACAPCCKVLERPLGGYVLLTAILSLIVLICSGVGLVDEKVGECDKPVLALLGGNVLFAIIHTGFAIYVQQKLLSGLASDRTSDFSSKQLMEQAGKIMLYDIGFCLYFFVFIASFGANCIGIAWVADCSLDTPLAMASAGLMIFYGVGVCWFMVLWYCVLACDTCMGDCLPFTKRQKPTSGGRRRGVLGFLLGSLSNSGSSSSQPPRQQPPASSVGMPQATGYVVQPAPVHQTPVQPKMSPAPAPQQTTQEPSAAAQVAAGGLQLAGKGLQAAAGWLGGKKDAKDGRK